MAGRRDPSRIGALFCGKMYPFEMMLGVACAGKMEHSSDDQQTYGIYGHEERQVQKSYWLEHSKDLSVENMMLDSRASDLDKEERPEILSLLPCYKEKSVLELGAGIGRFTGELAKEAGYVIALDFIESVIKKNEGINGHFPNATFMCADVTSPDLVIDDESIDLIFSNRSCIFLIKRLRNWQKGW